MVDFGKMKDLYEKYNYVHIGFFRLGVMYFLGGDSQKSRQCFKDSIKINTMFIPSYFGYVLSILGIVGKMITIFFTIFPIFFSCRAMRGLEKLLRPQGQSVSDWIFEINNKRPGTQDARLSPPAG